MKPNKTKAVLFDLYGTLIYVENKNKWLSKLTSELSLSNKEKRKLHNLILTNDYENIEDILTKNNIFTKINYKYYDELIQQECLSVRYYEETLSIIEYLKNQDIKIGIISNLATQYIAPIYNLKLHEKIEFSLLSCNIGIKKPTRKIYQTALDKLKYEPHKVIMAGDRIYTDLLGAVSCGIKTCHINRDKGDTLYKIMKKL
ncbi:HAD family hydrolase [Candidatus Woesearchaeota archaeon]|nr:HAD family hydrolase [Candidatus Woesearchaeota archaeon]